MPIIKSAKKALKSSKKKRVFNVRRKDAMNDIVKKIKKLVSEKKDSEARDLLKEAYKNIDKAAKRGIIKKNTADRKKSRLTILINKQNKNSA